MMLISTRLQYTLSVMFNLAQNQSTGYVALKKWQKAMNYHSNTLKKLCQFSQTPIMSRMFTSIANEISK